ncbi:energy-coupling factor ABC transporter ATP-binding protein [Listeria costaricensis]|uniref:energy-coupling factor ABC transporter ATP-binding protein n=1 Tax=Listeria costaricensis TaxID=2026604 RepID=UPI000C08B86B|nr:energy-coupling factor ABC transporter ATP-binding protein [Listeria costaricensis]
MIVEMRDVRYEYPSGEEALCGISFSLETTEPVAIIGQNGAGKTTTVKHLNGLLKPTSGEIFIEGIPIQSRQTAEWAKTVGYVFQNPDNQLFLETVKKEFEFGPKQIKMSKKEMADRMDWVAELVGLSEQLSVHPFDLSAVEKKFCTIGSVLMMKPKIVIFDEPTCGQDVEGNKRLKRIIRELEQQNILCITISHDMKFVAENFKRMIVLRKGSVILDGTREEVFKETEKLSSSYVSAPPITRLGQALGFDQLVFDADEFIKRFEVERK